MAPNYARLFGEAVQDSVRDYAAQNPETIRTGYFVGKLTRNGPDVPVWIGRIDHEPGNPENELDTGPIYIATIGTREADPLDAVLAINRWPQLSRKINREEHALLCAQMTWDQDFDPEAPLARPKRRVDISELNSRGPS
jgi:hypothetical protein